MQVFSEKMPDSTNLPSERFPCLKLFNFNISLYHLKDVDVTWNWWYTLLCTQNCASTTASPCILLTFLYQMFYISCMVLTERRYHLLE